MQNISDLHYALTARGQGPRLGGIARIEDGRLEQLGMNGSPAAGLFGTNNHIVGAVHIKQSINQTHQAKIRRGIDPIQQRQRDRAVIRADGKRSSHAEKAHLL